MLRLFSLLICGIFLLILPACCEQDKVNKTIHLSGQTMGTTWSIAVLPGQDGIEAAALRQQLQKRLDLINHLMSTYAPDSELSRFNNHTGTDWFTISDETARVIELSLEISHLTAGAFDVSIGPLVELWGFGAAARGDKIPSDEQVSAGLARVGYEKIRLRRDPAAVRKLSPELRIDLSAIAKGYAVDALGEILQQHGLRNYLVEIGGELRVSGQRGEGSPWQIAIEKPLESTREIATILPLTDTALATSGNYRNFYREDGQRYTHILDPSTGRPARHKLASVTVLDKTCARADALATALMVMGEDKGRQFCETHQIAAYFLLHDNDSIAVYTSSAFPMVEEVKK
ncbi:MAG: FAD:protein FMN transferase [Desulfuromonadales bacterium]